MSVLRNLATVPALFSRSLGDEESAPCAAAPWWRAVPGATAVGVPLAVLAISTVVLAALADAPMVRAASRIAALVLSG